MKLTQRKRSGIVLLGIGLVLLLITGILVLIEKSLKETSGTPVLLAVGFILSFWPGLILGVMGTYRLVTKGKEQTIGRATNVDAIWNPNAAGNWSLVFSMAFGSYLLMQNWRALGEPEKASTAQSWFQLSLVLIAVYLGLVFVRANPVVLNGFVVLFFILFVVWYFTVVRPQYIYVKKKFGNSYTRKPWGKAFLVGMAGLVFFIVMVRWFGPECRQIPIWNPLTGQHEFQLRCW